MATMWATFTTLCDYHNYNQLPLRKKGSLLSSFLVQSYILQFNLLHIKTTITTVTQSERNEMKFWLED